MSRRVLFLYISLGIGRFRLPLLLPVFLIHSSALFLNDWARLIGLTNKYPTADVAALTDMISTRGNGIDLEVDVEQKNKRIRIRVKTI